MKQTLFIFIISILAISCSTKKDILYFQNPEGLESMEKIEGFEPLFEINDIIQIDVTSLDAVVVAPFNKGQNNQEGGGQQGVSAQGYLVDIDGNIQFPVLGKLLVAGKSRSDLEKYLTSQIREYVTDAVIAVRLLNFRVIVLGETGQSVVQVDNEKITIPELLATVGGITYNGKRDNILVIREVDGKKSFGRVDMTTSDVFKNPFYNLRQNDIVYVEPTYRTVKAAGFITSWQGLVSIVTTVFGLIILFTR